MFYISSLGALRNVLTTNAIFSCVRSLLDLSLVDGTSVKEMTLLTHTSLCDYLECSIKQTDSTVVETWETMRTVDGWVGWLQSYKWSDCICWRDWIENSDWLHDEHFQRKNESPVTAELSNPIAILRQSSQNDFVHLPHRTEAQNFSECKVSYVHRPKYDTNHFHMDSTTEEQRYALV